MNTKIIIFALSLLSLFSVQSQENQALTTADKCKDKQIFDSYIIKKNNDKSDFNLSLVQTALHFLNSPYESATLENNKSEQLVINLKAFDCMTFVENCLALTKIANSEKPDFDNFKKELQTIRYRDEIINGYTSRLHYTSDWIRNNEKKGIIKDITQTLNGIILPLHINFMSTHPNLYPHLSSHPEDIEKMEQIENAINKHSYYYIPKEKIKACEKQIKSGDIICFVTSTKGLDISHLGIAFHKNNMLTFIHASTKAKKVIINPVSISDYCKSITSNKGIIVLRMESGELRMEN